MDISSIKPTEKTVEILHPATEEEIGIRVTLISMDDPAMKNHKRQVQDRRLKKEQKGKALKSRELEDDMDELIFRAMKGWEWYKPEGAKQAANFRGETPKFNRKNVLDVFAELPWFLDQLNEHLGEEKDFFIKS